MQTVESVPRWRWWKSLGFPGAIAVANSAIFLFQIMAARMTAPAAFGQVVALLGVMLIIEAPASPIQVLLSRAVQKRARTTTAPEETIDIGPLVAVALVTGTLLCAALLPLTAVLGRVLHLPFTPYLVAFYVVPVMAAVVPRGVLAGLGQFRWVSISLAGSALIRLLVGTVLLHSGFGVNGVMAAVVIGEVAASGALLIAARRRTAVGGTPLSFAWKEPLGEGLTFTGFWLLAGIDLVVAQHYLVGPASGDYGAGATLAQLVMIFPGAAAAFLSARLSTRPDGSPRDFTLVRPLLAVAIASLLVGGIVNFFRTSIIDAVFDSQYRGGLPIVGLLLTTSAVLGLITVLQQYLIGRRELRPAAMPWLGVIIFLAAAAIDHRTMTTVGLDLLIATAVTFALMLVIAVHGLRYVSREPSSSVRLDDLDADLDLTVVVPYYNPGATLKPNLRRLLEVLTASPVDFEVIAVSDGSTDGSESTIADLVGGRVRHEILPLNQGKGAALRVGLASGRGRYLGFIDADGDLDPQLLEAFLTLVRLYQPDVVIGSKRHPLSQVDYPLMRWIYSVGFQCLVRGLFRLKVRDTQTGIKLFRRDVVAAALPRMLEKRFAFDLEMLVVAHRLGFTRMLEAPVILRHQFKSTISIRAVRYTLLDTLAIFYRLHILKTYDHMPSPQDLLHGINPAFVRGISQLPRAVPLGGTNASAGALPHPRAGSGN